MPPGRAVTDQSEHNFCTACQTYGHTKTQCRNADGRGSRPAIGSQPSAVRGALLPWLDKDGRREDGEQMVMQDGLGVPEQRHPGSMPSRVHSGPTRSQGDGWERRPVEGKVSRWDRGAERREPNEGGSAWGAHGAEQTGSLWAGGRGIGGRANGHRAHEVPLGGGPRFDSSDTWARQNGPAVPQLGYGPPHAADGREARGGRVSGWGWGPNAHHAWQPDRGQGYGFNTDWPGNDAWYRNEGGGQGFGGAYDSWHANGWGGDFYHPGGWAGHDAGPWRAWPSGGWHEGQTSEEQGGDWRAHGGLRPGPHASPRAEQGTGESVMPAVRDGPHPSSLERGRGGIEPSGENGAPSGRQQQGGGRDEVHGVGEAEGREEEKGSEGEEVFASLWEEGGEWSINARIQRLMSIVEIVPGREKEAVCGKLWGRVGGREKQTVVNGVVRQSGINTTNARSAKNRNIFGVPVNC